MNQESTLGCSLDEIMRGGSPPRGTQALPALWSSRLPAVGVPSVEFVCVAFGLAFGAFWLNYTLKHCRGTIPLCS